MNFASLLGALVRLPWRWYGVALTCMAIYLIGFAMGQRDVQQAWTSERQRQQLAAAQQSVHVAQMQTQQERINQKVSTDYENQKFKLGNRTSVVRPGDSGVCVIPIPTRDPMPSVAAPAIAVSASTANPVPDSYRDEGEGAVSCEQLARDSAQTTLMLLGLQRWYKDQSEAANP